MLIQLNFNLSKFYISNWRNFATQSKKAYCIRKQMAIAISKKKFFVWRDFEEAASTTSDCYIQIAFDFPSGNGKDERIFMKRGYADKFSQTNVRLQNKLKAFLTMEEMNVLQAFSATGKIIPEEATNYDAFFGPHQCVRIKLANTEYSIVRDAVWLDKVEIAMEPLVGCPVIPSTDWKKESNEVKYHWFVSDGKSGPLKIKFVDSPKCPVQMEGWEYVGTGLSYWPSELDVGKYLAVVVDVGEHGIAHGSICPTRVKKANDCEGEELIFERRQAQYCSEKLDGERFRLVTYNVLAHLYLKDWLKKKGQDDQYFPYCPKQFQFDKYRYPLLLREIPGYNADLLFLQEVDFRFQKRFLVPFLKLTGYSPVFNCKQNQVNEGLVVAYRSDRFELVDGANYTVKLAELLENPFNADIFKFMQRDQQIFRVLSTRPTILQLVHLRTSNGLDVLAANTHLHFDPAHEEVKVLQALLCIRYIFSLVANKFPSQCPPQVLFAGDFNLEPGTVAVRMIQGEQVHLPIDKNDAQRQTTTVAAAPSFMQRLKAYIQRNFFVDPSTNSARLVIREPVTFQCASGFPEYTNYTRAEAMAGFVGCLDYIWAYPPVQIDHIVPMPGHQLVTKYGAIPSKICPSDHLPLITDITLPSSSETAKANRS